LTIVRPVLMVHVMIVLITSIKIEVHVMVSKMYIILSLTEYWQYLCLNQSCTRNMLYVGCVQKAEAHTQVPFDPSARG